MSKKRKHKRNKHSDSSHYSHSESRQNRITNARYKRINRDFDEFLRLNRFEKYDVFSNRRKNRVKRDFVKIHRNRLRDISVLAKSLNKSNVIDKRKYKDKKKEIREDLRTLKEIEVCLKRKKRRESLFGLNIIGSGKGGHNKFHLWNEDSRKVRC